MRADYSNSRGRCLQDRRRPPAPGHGKRSSLLPQSNRVVLWVSSLQGGTLFSSLFFSSARCPLLSARCYLLRWGTQ